MDIRGLTLEKNSQEDQTRFEQVSLLVCKVTQVCKLVSVHCRCSNFPYFITSSSFEQPDLRRSSSLARYSSTHGAEAGGSTMGKNALIQGETVVFFTPVIRNADQGSRRKEGLAR